MAEHKHPNGRRLKSKQTRDREAKVRAMRQPEVSRLNLDGYTMREIAAKLGCGLATVHADMKVIRAQWASENNAEITKHRDRELVALTRQERDVLEKMAAIKAEDALARETIAALLKSGDLDDHKTAGRLAESLAKRDEHKHASKWHEVLLKIREARRKLLGLDAPAKVETKTEHVGAVAFTDDVARILGDPDATERLLDAVQGAPVNRVAEVVVESSPHLPANGNGVNGTNGVAH